MYIQNFFINVCLKSTVIVEEREEDDDDDDDVNDPDDLSLHGRYPIVHW